MPTQTRERVRVMIGTVILGTADLSGHGTAQCLDGFLMPAGSKAGSPPTGCTFVFPERTP